MIDSFVLRIHLVSVFCKINLSTQRQITGKREHENCISVVFLKFHVFGYCILNQNKKASLTNNIVHVIYCTWKFLFNISYNKIYIDKWTANAWYPTPSTKFGGTDKNYYDPSLTQYNAWFVALPSAKVQGNLTYNGQTHQVQGSGYHDHNWGTVQYNKVLDTWYWTRTNLGNYTLDLAFRTASSFYNHQQYSAFYLAKGNQVLVEDTELLTV